MFQHGAAEALAVDTGYGQIHARLRSDPRVKLLEKTNARYLTQEDITNVGAAAHRFHRHRRFVHLCYTRSPCSARVGISANGHPRRDLSVILIKPQFEVGRERVGKGGIVKDEAAQQDAVMKSGKKWKSWAART